MSNPPTPTIEEQLDEIIAWVKWVADRNGGLLNEHAREAERRLSLLITKAQQQALAKHVLAGMPELTPRQQDYITKVLARDSPL